MYILGCATYSLELYMIVPFGIYMELPCIKCSLSGYIVYMYMYLSIHYRASSICWISRIMNPSVWNSRLCLVFQQQQWGVLERRRRVAGYSKYVCRRQITIRRHHIHPSFDPSNLPFIHPSIRSSLPPCCPLVSPSSPLTTLPAQFPLFFFTPINYLGKRKGNIMPTREREREIEIVSDKIPTLRGCLPLP